MVVREWVRLGEVLERDRHISKKDTSRDCLHVFACVCIYIYICIYPDEPHVRDSIVKYRERI